MKKLTQLALFVLVSPIAALANTSVCSLNSAAKSAAGSPALMAIFGQNDWTNWDLTLNVSDSPIAPQTAELSVLVGHAEIYGFRAFLDNSGSGAESYQDGSSWSVKYNEANGSADVSISKAQNTVSISCTSHN
jgi:hypothetical protein